MHFSTGMLKGLPKYHRPNKVESDTERMTENCGSKLHFLLIMLGELDRIVLFTVHASALLSQ